eukprot:318395-Pelagomonas_calceolata.AAC.6
MGGSETASSKMSSSDGASSKHRIRVCERAPGAPCHARSAHCMCLCRTAANILLRAWAAQDTSAYKSFWCTKLRKTFELRVCVGLRPPSCCAPGQRRTRVCKRASGAPSYTRPAQCIWGNSVRERPTCRPQRHGRVLEGKCSYSL